jgi:branched-chain amino acid transport system permease protein
MFKAFQQFRNYSSVSIIAVALILLALPLFMRSKFFLVLGSEIFIYTIFAMSLDLMMGYTGMVPFGHAVFFGLGGYGAGLTLVNLTSSFFLSILIGVAISLFASFVIGSLTIRLTGVYFAMLTLAFAQMFYVIAFKWITFTGGSDGMVVPIPILDFIRVNLNDPVIYYYISLIFLFFSYSILKRITRSPIGLVFKSIKDNEERSEALGYNVNKYKQIVFFISAIFAGLAGALYAMLQGFVSADFLHFSNSIEAITIILVGGIGTMVGSFLGSVGVIIFKDFISSFTRNWLIILGIIYIVFVLFVPGGLISLIRSILRRE